MLHSLGYNLISPLVIASCFNAVIFQFSHLAATWYALALVVTSSNIPPPVVHLAACHLISILFLISHRTDLLCIAAPLFTFLGCFLFGIINILQNIINYIIRICCMYVCMYVMLQLVIIIIATLFNINNTFIYIQCVYVYVAADVFDLISQPKHASKGLVVRSSYFEIYSGKVRTSICLLCKYLYNTNMYGIT